ncbi:MAG: putative membrane protein [Anaerolinea thermophila]|uniref:Putative membrane protein n=1 Tax=Anaerolinea thermophila TaxID=167964 RepID=A0A124FMX9_9CHLR|nr:MAG: putative membrane protein [Anaerolinea thermophila]
MNQQENKSSTQETLTCYKHPDRETYLRCNQCDRPICPSCAILTPTGYRCQDCVRGQEKKFNTAQLSDYIIACIVSALIAFFGSYMARFLGFFTLLLAPLASMLITEVVLKLTKGRNADSLNKVILISAIVGSLPLVIVDLYNLFVYMSAGMFSINAFLPLIWQIGYTIIMATSLQSRIKGLYIG